MSGAKKNSKGLIIAAIVLFFLFCIAVAQLADSNVVIVVVSAIAICFMAVSVIVVVAMIYNGYRQALARQDTDKYEINYERLFRDMAASLKYRNTEEFWKSFKESDLGVVINLITQEYNECKRRLLQTRWVRMARVTIYKIRKLRREKEKTGNQGTPAR